MFYRSVIIMLFLITTFSSMAQTFLNEDCIALQKAFFAMQKNNSKENQEVFFNLFPRTTADFVLIYTYSDFDALNCKLENDALMHINNGFAKLNKIPKDQLYSRYIRLASNMDWYADAQNYFQHLLIQKVNTDTKAFIGILEGFNTQEQIGFWRFYFDGPVPLKEIPTELKHLEKSHPATYRLVYDAFISAKPYR